MLKIRHAFTPVVSLESFRKLNEMFWRIASGRLCAALLLMASYISRYMLLRDIFSAGFSKSYLVSSMNYWMRSPC